MNEPRAAESRTPESLSRRKGGEIERSDTALRIGLSLLMGLVWSVVESILALGVVFALIWTLVTRTPPPERLRELSNHLLAYAYQIWRYLTYNDARVPFPFSDFPAPLDPPGDPGRDEAREVKALLPFDDDETGTRE